MDWFNPDAAAVVRWTVGQLDEDCIGWMRDLPEEAWRQHALLVHASPRDPVFEYVLDAGTAAANLALLGDDGICFHGHTHLPGVFSLVESEVVHGYSRGLVPLIGPALVNPGSVGQPRDHDPDASYGLWDTDTGGFEFRRVPYDREAAKRAILEAGLPMRFATRLDFGY
jgi:diadenosine tetraphosphatase ApaH/serine/threonine PP2A family protein phosphatase